MEATVSTFCIEQAHEVRRARGRELMKKVESSAALCWGTRERELRLGGEFWRPPRRAAALATRVCNLMMVCRLFSGEARE